MVLSPVGQLLTLIGASWVMLLPTRSGILAPLLHNQSARSATAAQSSAGRFLAYSAKPALMKEESCGALAAKSRTTSDVDANEQRSMMTAVLARRLGTYQMTHICRREIGPDRQRVTGRWVRVRWKPEAEGEGDRRSRGLWSGRVW
jgi:hypothetical protein